jgi:hypothetical protein
MLSSSTMAVSEKPFISSAVTSEAGPINQSTRAWRGVGQLAGQNRHLHRHAAEIIEHHRQAAGFR